MPEYVGVVKDFIIVIEDNKSMSYHESRTDEGILAEDKFLICDYALNGALFMANILLKILHIQK